jgi:pyruvate dehydrogenase kinase 2/3/4
MNEERLSALHRMTEHGFPITVADQMTRWRAGQQQQLEQQRNQSHGADESSEEEKGVNRMGLGLPLSNIYARYFGGSLDLMSLDGWGESRAFRFLTRVSRTQMNCYITLSYSLFCSRY